MEKLIGSSFLYPLESPRSKLLLKQSLGPYHGDLTTVSSSQGPVPWLQDECRQTVLPIVVSARVCVFSMNTQCSLGNDITVASRKTNMATYIDERALSKPAICSCHRVLFAVLAGRLHILSPPKALMSRLKCSFLKILYCIENIV